MLRCVNAHKWLHYIYLIDKAMVTALKIFTWTSIGRIFHLQPRSILLPILERACLLCVSNIQLCHLWITTLRLKIYQCCYDWSHLLELLAHWFSHEADVFATEGAGTDSELSWFSWSFLRTFKELWSIEPASAVLDLDHKQKNGMKRRILITACSKRSSKNWYKVSSSWQFQQQLDKKL